MEITYTTNDDITVDQFIDILRRSTLGDRRPIDDRECVAGMLAHADLTICARVGQKLVGVARSVTDFHYCCYLSDLAVDAVYQKHGIGLELQRRTQERLGPQCKLILLAAPAASSYYPHVGYSRHDSCWILGRDQRLAPSR